MICHWTWKWTFMTWGSFQQSGYHPTEGTLMCLTGEFLIICRLGRRTTAQAGTFYDWVCMDEGSFNQCWQMIIEMQWLLHLFYAKKSDLGRKMTFWQFSILGAKLLNQCHLCLFTPNDSLICLFYVISENRNLPVIRHTWQIVTTSEDFIHIYELSIKLSVRFSVL